MIARGLKSLNIALATAVLLFGSLLATSSARAQSAGCNSVQRELAYGEAAIQDAKNRAGYLEAAKQYRAAIAKAPKCAAAHFNLGVAYEKAGRLSSAMTAFETYLKLAPNAKDAASVRKTIFKLDYRIKRAGQRKRIARKRKPISRKSSKPAQSAVRVADLVGIWAEESGSNCKRVYQLTATLGKKIAIRYLRSKCRRGATVPPHFEIFRLNVNGRSLTGTLVFRYSDLCGGRMPRVSLQVSGTIASDGSRIVIVQKMGQRFFMMWNCKWGYLKKDSVTQFSRHR